jgi:16S rRNA processing protein RimM
LSNTYSPVKEFFLLGKTLKSHGTAGFLRLMIDDRLKGYVKPGLFVFFDLNGSRVPFQVKAVEDAQHFVMLLEGINGKQESDTLTGKEIWIPMEQVKARHLKSPRNIDEKWDDYMIHDEKSNISFRILRTEEYPQQLMAVIEINEQELLVPLHEQLILNIDREEKIIRMEIPEGLLDL